jgi:tellurite resistance protein TehA-like permease
MIRAGWISLAAATIIGLWWLFAIFLIVASVSGGPYGSHPFSEFVIAYFPSGCMLFALLGVGTLIAGYSIRKRERISDRMR